MEYSPFHGYNQQNTAHQQTTSYKNYPIDKYFSQDPTEVKYKLFCDKNQNVHQRLNQLKFQKPSRKRQDSIKSCNIKSKPKRSTTKLKVLEQYQEQLQIYKDLCMTLRKQNQQLSLKLLRQDKRQSKFSTQIQQLKVKIKKMYSCCIQKNMANSNTGNKQKSLAQKYSRNADKQNSSGIFSIKKPSVQLKRNFGAGFGKMNKKTIDSTRASNEKSSFLLGQINFSKNSKQPIIQRKKADSERLLNKPLKIISYDDQDFSYDKKDEILELDSTNIKIDGCLQFFKTFVKSLQIFQNHASNKHKNQAKLLKYGGYFIQWAKQEWLQIVEYLIKKGYVSGNEIKNKNNH